MALSITGTPPISVIGAAFSFTPVISGGTAPYTVTASPALPTGYTLDATTGKISSTAVPSGKVSTTLTVTDSDTTTPATSTLEVSFTPVAALVLTPVTQTGYTDKSVTIDPVVTGGSGTKTYEISSGSLPAGVSIAPTTGIISGTITTAGTFTFTVRVSDASGATTARYSLTIYKTPQVVNTTLPVGEVGVPMKWTPDARYGDGSTLTVKVDASTLPKGLSADTHGVITGTPTAAGNSSISITTTDGTTSTTQTLGATIIAAVTLTGDAPKGYVISTYEWSPVVSSGKPPYTWSVRALPKGLSFDETTGTLSGTFSAPGSFPIDLSVVDALGGSATLSTQIVVEEAVPLLFDLPGLKQNAVTSLVLSADDVSDKATYALSGTLPKGLVYTAATATISGTPIESGTFPLTVTITDGSTTSVRLASLVVAGGMIDAGASIHPLDIQYADAVDVLDNVLATDLTTPANQTTAAAQLFKVTQMLLRAPTPVALALMWEKHQQYSSSLFGNALFSTLVSALPDQRSAAVVTTVHTAFHAALTDPSAVLNLDELVRLTRQPRIVSFIESKLNRIVG